MHSTDNPPGCRRTRGRSDLNINTSLASTSTPTTSSRSRNVIPQTPPDCTPPPAVSSSKSHSQPSGDSRALRFPSSTTHHHHPHESFLDNPTPVEVAMADFPSRAPQRDSHDLSLSPRNVTRDSLVANMLLSLDQFSMGQIGDSFSGASNPQTQQTQPKTQSQSQSHAYDESPHLATADPMRTWANSASVSANAGRVNGHQYSYSSDLEGADDSSRMSSQNSRGRRSNSSSNFQPSQPGFSRLNSVRESVSRNQPGTSRAAHSRGGKGSKSSSTNSVDAAPADTHKSLAANQTQQSVPPSPFRVEFSNNFLADEYDAAPTPTVHGGPRRDPPSMPAMPSIPSKPAATLPPLAPIELPSLDRKRSITKSLKSTSGRKAPVSREVAPAMPTLDLDSAPAPHVGYEKTKEAVHGGPTPATAPAQVKERPGFFRRVFGSRSNSHNSHSSNHDPVNNSSNSNTLSPADHTGSPASSKLHTNVSTPPSRDTSSSHSHHPVLQKKPSSFFRRRKKSVNEDPPPMPMPVPAPPIPHIAPIEVASERDRAIPKAQHSPVSSLRKVMNPYLRTAPGTPGTPGGQGAPLAGITNTPPGLMNDITERVEYKRGFSPEYEPSPNAKIRSVCTDSDGDVSHRTDSPTRAPPERPSRSVQTRNNSFLDLDGGSDNEDGQASPSARKSAARALNKDINATVRGDVPRAPHNTPNDDTIRCKKWNKPETTDSDDDPSPSNLALPIEGARAASPASVSTGTDYKSAMSAPPSVRVETSNEPSPKVLGTFDSMKAKSLLDEPEFVVGEPTEDDRQKAHKIYEGNEDFIQKEKAAAWMGEEGPIRQRTLQAYMELYDFTSQSIVHALRQVCGRLVFRAETQQVDRILVAFSKRWCHCNPNHGFKATDVIHTICYSIFLLNTDLHMADIEYKMTRSQFVKNTMTTIIQAASESVPDAFERPSILPDRNAMLGADSHKASVEHDRRSFRNSFRPPPRPDTGAPAADGDDDCGPLVKAPFTGSKKAWEEQIEVVLKGIYVSIRDERLPLFGAEPDKNLNIPSSQSSLSVIGMLKRSPSVLSKAPSESHLSMRGRIAENGRNTTARWTSKSRSRPGMGRAGFSSSRTSFDDGSSIWSPTLSSATWSRYSLGRTQTSMSQDSFGSAMPRGDYQQSIGFANALSQAIIRDEDAYEGAPSILSADIPSTQLLEDESLELAGPPWVKEGMVVHKHHLDGVDKKAKDRHWTEVFAVCQKGQMSLFSFTSNKSSRQKDRSRNVAKPHAPVGGGNWQDNATSVGTFSLRQTLASALPPPGYSRSRPNVWALSLPNGSVHLFQVGTPEIAKEFVTTVNYWSARLSTHPLVGGISNIEYGWSEHIVNNALVAAINETTVPGGKTSRPGSSAARRSSVSSGGFRGSSFDQVAGAFTNNSGRGKLPGDRIHISVWSPPTQSLRPSHATETEQLETLDAYVKGVEAELQTHNQLRSPMLLAFSPRGSNVAKAMANWECKSAYLLREIVKFRTYVDCLHQAEARKLEIYAERDLAQRAARGELSDGDMEVSSSEEGDETLRP
ncbi:hypothetical protein G7046_g6580 [Stylonectria norvegica]|nr:hypothetical protein G7046_g6580 [Stylonectria norvegica]